MKPGQDRYPALAGAIALHLGVFALGFLLTALLNKPIYGPTVTPVTLISTEQNPAPAIQSPEPTPDVTPPTPPTPQSLPQPVQPPAPKPAPPTPTPKPAPSPKPAAKPSPTAAKTPTPPAQTSPDDDSFMSSLSKDLAKNGSPSHPKPPSRPTPGTGKAPSAAALASLSAQLQRLWNPNCDVMGGADVNLTVRFVLGPSGRVIGQPVSSVGDATDPIVKAASDRAIRAIRAVFQTKSITGLSPDHYAVNFNARQACGQ